MWLIPYYVALHACAYARSLGKLDSLEYIEFYESFRVSQRDKADNRFDHTNTRSYVQYRLQLDDRDEVTEYI